ncbi:ATP-binding protein [Actinokineospora soli]|uniref:ATP-binding protein n=1 Tax=Actinokineospora soli TaxID=1048753 RepID=A0ABW2TNR4_9PSEU
MDLHRFRALVAAARARSSAEETALGLYGALALWRGDPLAGVAGSAVVDRVRAGLAQERLAVTEEWAERELELGRHREILGELTALCAEHPFQEKLVGLLVLTLHRCGRQAEALQRYEECRRLLADSLGVDPGDELRAAHERILRADADAARPAPEPTRPRRRPSTLPFDIPDFAGRAAEVDRLLGTTTARGAVVTIDGMAGVGKSATAVRVAHRLAERYPDAQVFVDLHGFTPSREPVPPAAALDTLLRSVGVPAGEIPAELDHRVAAWRAEMAGRRAVVVLDNAIDAAQVRPLIPGAPGCVVIVTSRKRLPTLEGAVALSLDVLPADDARALVEGVVGPAPGERAALDELAELCGRLPLALRIVAARLRHRPQWTVADLVDRLRSEQQRLEELRVDDHDLAAAFALSYRHLDTDQQRVFRLLGVHQGADIDAHAAAALTGLPLRRAADLLDELVDHHLLEQRTRGRFGFHDLLREHAHTLLSDEDDPGARGAGCSTTT